jgi:hypothetical protein
MTPDILRSLLVAYAIAGLVIALAYLQRRRLSIGELLIWGMIVICVPVLGPFTAIAARPGHGPRRRRFARRQTH